MIRPTLQMLMIATVALGTAAVAYGAPKRTGFDPAKHGFKFVNNFRNDFISELDIRTGGLCGGMSYAALDFYHAKLPIPQQTHRPAVQTALHDYIYDRQVHSIADNVDKWTEIGFNPLGARNSEFFKWGLQGYEGGRLEELRSKIDRGQPVPLGMQNYDGDGPGNHQVVAIGYDMGRYRGDLNEHKEDLKIFVYDPNHPGATRTLRADLKKEGWYYEEDPRKIWRTYFVDMKYKPKTPPKTVVDSRNKLPAGPKGSTRELLVTIKTGGDDLRGGDDNLNIVVNVKGKPRQRFANVNKGRRWIDNYEQTITLPLLAPVPPEDIESIVLQTTFGGGIGGDNWNMDQLCVDVMKDGRKQRLYEKSGEPLKRFTGDDKTFTASL